MNILGPIVDELIGLAGKAAGVAFRAITSGITDEKERQAKLDKLFNETLDRRAVEVEAAAARTEARAAQIPDPVPTAKP